MKIGNELVVCYHSVGRMIVNAADDECEVHEMVSVTICGEVKQIGDDISVSELLQQENVEMQQYVTVSINEEFVGRDDYGQRLLRDGDVVEFLYFMGGGR